MRFIKNYIESKIGELDFQLTLTEIIFQIPGNRHIFKYKIKDVLNLLNGKKRRNKRNRKIDRIKNKNLFYLKDYGLQFKDYYEFFVSITPDEINFINESFAIDLNFQIENIQFNFSPPSDFFNFIMYFVYKNIYSDIVDKGFDEKYFTLKIFKGKNIEVFNWAQQAIFYINSDLLTNIQHKFYLTKLDSTEEITRGFDLEEKEIIDVLELNESSRKKKFKKKPLIPLKIYNYSLLQEYYNKYIYLYKILEYYASLNKIKKIELLRKDDKIDTAILIDYIKNSNEEKVLANLFEDCLPNDEVERFKYIISNNRYLKESKGHSLSKIIYNYRNSIVHSKEEKIEKSIIPELFPTDFTLESMNLLIEEVVAIVIENFSE